jgi:hypothetical protein
MSVYYSGAALILLGVYYTAERLVCLHCMPCKCCDIEGCAVVTVVMHPVRDREVSALAKPYELRCLIHLNVKLFHR